MALELDSLILWQILPYLLITILFGIFLFFGVSYYLGRTKPPTDEPVIGQWQFILKGTGGTVEGLTTTARTVADAAVLSRLKALGEVDKLGEVLKEIYLYAVRDGRDKVLVISDVSIEDHKYSEKEGRTRYVIGFGPVSYRRAVGFAWDFSKETDPEFFKQHTPKWGRAVYLFPDDLENGGTRDQKLPEGIKDLQKLLILVEEVSLDAASMKIKDDRIQIQDKHLRNLGDQVTTELDRRLFSDQEALSTSPFEAPGEPMPRRGPFPRMTLGRLLLITVAGGGGYYYLPNYSKLLPNSAAVVGAAAMWLFWFAWERWISEWF